MSTPEARCAGAPTDEERENCIAANKEMGDDRRDGPGQASDSTVVGSTGDGCAGLSMDELANCIGDKKKSSRVAYKPSYSGRES